jgi:hypothetical protein
VPDATDRPIGGAGPAIETVEGDAASVEGVGEFAGAGAEFEHGFGWTEERRKRAEKPAEVAHRAVGKAQIAAIVQGGRMIRRERIEDLGLQHAGHREPKVARRAEGVQCAAQFIA